MFNSDCQRNLFKKKKKKQNDDELIPALKVNCL